MKWRKQLNFAAVLCEKPSQELSGISGYGTMLLQEKLFEVILLLCFFLYFRYRLEHAQVNADIAKKLVEACAKFCWELGVEPRVLQWEVESLSWVSSWVQLYWGPEAMLGLIVNPVNSIVWGGPIFAGGTPWNPDNPAPDAGLRGYKASYGWAVQEERLGTEIYWAAGV